MPDINRLSLNQYTTFNWTVKEALEGCARAHLDYACLWRDKILAQGVEESARIAKELGIKISSLCRGGMFPAATREERQKRIDDNLRAIDECATLETDTLVFVCGGLHSKDLDGARQMVYDGLAAITPYAQERGVKLGIEPLHPMYAADRNVIVTLGQANDFALRLNKEFSQYETPVGVVIDVFHVWWDPTVYDEIKRAEGHIFGFHVCDWITPLPDTLKGRGMMGDGWIEIRRLREAVEEAGYTGPIECEIFNQELWDRNGDEVLELMKERYLELC
ncbi:MAG: sugar phosphate isomerase/epimerase [Trueperaceae bacterium]|nr:sugar phosphate isomerase/epimerase [Trueperaceae bacterium]